MITLLKRSVDKVGSEQAPPFYSVSPYIAGNQPLKLEISIHRIELLLSQVAQIAVAYFYVQMNYCSLNTPRNSGS